MSDPLILLEITDGVARITLNDPARLNPVSPLMIDQAMVALETAEAEARVVMITGAGKAFCSGANLAAGMGSDRLDPSASVITHLNPLIRRIRGLSIPVITAVRGAAAGYGASLALAGDLIVATETAFFMQAFRNIGLVPDGGATYTLVKAVGRVRAVELMLLGQRLPAAKALEWGLITRVVADEALEPTVDGLAHDLANGPTIALGKIRQMAWAACEGGFEDELDLEAVNQRICGQSDDFAIGLTAFLEKRPATFTGR